MAESPLRFTFGGDEHLFAEISESMSLSAFFRGLEITQAIEKAEIPGVLDICLANASFQVRFNPDITDPLTLRRKVQTITDTVSGRPAVLDTRIIEIPVLYNDPWTHETLMRFRDRHQDPESTDLEYAAKINGFGGIQEFIDAHSGAPWFVSMVGFVAGLPFMFQMVEQQKQLEVPKYLSPRTDTPRQTLGHGGCFGCIYSVRGAGGYQMFGVTPVPIYDPAQKLSYFSESMVFFRTGDIVRFRAVEREEYDAILEEVEAGNYTPRIRPVHFDLQKFQADPEQYRQDITEALYVS